ncbi:MAG: T9SS type A sorting domain-containing protein [Ignavibacteria bacterium]|nr:T9SS type A sorting domain-containing protein [Ignavibacteria bacterium]
MKILVITLLSFTLTANLTKTYSWDSTAAKYMPLQVGNVWVYRGTTGGYMQFGRSYQTYAVTGVLDTLGKKYYVLSFRSIMISGTLSSGVNQFGSPIRIDSSTMNVYSFRPYCNRSEMLWDSLKAKQNDSAYICPSEFFYANSLCVDTSNYYIFGNSYPSKRFIEFMGPGYGTVYVKGIGIAYSSYGYQMNQNYDTLIGCIINGVVYGDTSIVVGITQISTEVPNLFSLSQNYPNPFNPTTNIGFRIANFGLVRIIVYDALGREIQTLVDQELTPGTYEVRFDGSNLPSGVYYYKLAFRQAGSSTGSFTETKRMVILK